MTSTTQSENTTFVTADAQTKTAKSEGATFATGGTQTSVKKQKAWAVIAKRELSATFQSPLAYIIIAVNIILLAATFFKGLFLGYQFFLYKSVDVRLMFLFQAVLLTLFVPILTMKSYADEKRTLTIETLMTLPVTELDVAVAKMISSFVTALAVIAPDVIIVFLVGFCGPLDLSQVLSGFIGLALIIALFSSVGIFASSISRHQNVALFISLPVTAVMMSIYVPFTIPTSIPSFIDNFFRFLSSYEHFTAISRGVLDLRDVVYFVTVTAVFFYATVLMQKKAKD